MKKGFFLLGILLFPSIIYLLFSLGEHHVQKMGAYGDFEITAEGDTVYKGVPELHLTMSNGEAKKLSDFAGRAIILNVFRMPCDDLCKKKGATLANYLIELSEPKKWCIINLCVTENADLDELGEVAKVHEIGMENWFFASSPSAEETNAFLDYVFLKNRKSADLNQIPNNYFVLIDQNQVVREFFDSKVYQDNKKMEDAIKLTLVEQFMSWKNK